MRVNWLISEPIRTFVWIFLNDFWGWVFLARRSIEGYRRSWGIIVGKGVNLVQEADIDVRGLDKCTFSDPWIQDEVVLCLWQPILISTAEIEDRGTLLDDSLYVGVVVVLGSAF
jgi:hypothetical protein